MLTNSGKTQREHLFAVVVLVVLVHAMHSVFVENYDVNKYSSYFFVWKTEKFTVENGEERERERAKCNDEYEKK